MNKKRKIKYKSILIFIFLIILIFSLIKITLFLVDNKKAKEKHQKLVKEVVDIKEDDTTKEEVFSVDFNKLKETNEDVVGWIIYNNNKINYPIVQTSNNTYYLTHLIDRTYNQNGSIFLDYRNNSFDDKNTVIFGHSTFDGTMFGSIIDMFNSSSFFENEENNYITILTPNNETNKYKIFSYYIIEKEEYYIKTQFSSDLEFQRFIDIMKQRSYKDFNVEVNSDNKIITLSTCYGTGNTAKRQVVQAVLMKDGV